MFQEMSQKITFLQGSEKHLQEELTQLKHSHNELNCKYESDVSGLKQDVERYQEEVKHEKDANIERENENLQLINNLRAEKEELFQKMSGEITIRQKREKQMLHELDQVHILHEELKCRYERDIMDIQQQVETYEQKVKQEETVLSNREQKEKLIQERKHSALQQVENLQQQVKQERKAHLEKTEEDKKLLDQLRAKYAVLKENTTTENKILQDKEKSAQAELEKVNGLYLELNCRFETEVTALKHQAEKYQQEISCVKNDLQSAREDLLLPDTLRAEEEGFQQKPITVSQEKEEDSQNKVDLVKVFSQEVSSEEELSGEPLSGSSTDPESSEETEIAGETVLEDLDNPDTKTMQDDRSKVRNQTKCSPKIPYDENDHWKQWFCSPVHEVPPWSQAWGWGTLGSPWWPGFNPQSPTGLSPKRAHGFRLEIVGLGPCCGGAGG
ncbi:golgin subfamily A member 6-like protein 22 [Xiphophorus hellerii]|uniref:golgin subfamily A member 6-like protein 22 n=1 Tax=Xiphophorus hellerii TaxID=8084 RepID=UPI0013B3B680|nr:golgin subfamily A member 6-like protein 22 [Xiphophorus hellerii]